MSDQPAEEVTFSLPHVLQILRASREEEVYRLIVSSEQRPSGRKYLLLMNFSEGGSNHDRADVVCALDQSMAEILHDELGDLLARSTSSLPPL